LKVPTLVIAGVHDFIPVETAAHVVQAIPGAKLVTLQNCGQFSYMECPDVRKALDDFFKDARLLGTTARYRCLTIRRMRGFIILLAGACCLGGAVSEARISYAWTFEELQAKSDVVVIAQWLGTRDLNVKAVLDDVEPPYPVVTINSDFNVLTTFKGEVNSKTLKLRHFRTDTELLPGAVLNGPVLVAFGHDPVNVYLLFLKKDFDGMFSPTSGQIDQYVSVLMLPKQFLAALEPLLVR